jgi:hypothetical protein
LTLGGLSPLICALGFSSRVVNTHVQSARGRRSGVECTPSRLANTAYAFVLVANKKHGELTQALSNHMQTTRGVCMNALAIQYASVIKALLQSWRPASGAGLLALAASVAHAQIVVDPSPTTTCITASTHFFTIQSAVNSARAGKTIFVCPGVYAEQVTIGKPLTLKGVTNPAANTGAAIITAPGLNSITSDGIFAAQIRATVGPVTLADLVVDGAGAESGCGAPQLAGIEFSYAVASTGTVNHVALRNQNVPDGSGGYCQLGVGIATAFQASLVVQQSSIHDFDGGGVSAVYASVVGSDIVGVNALVNGEFAAFACISAGVTIGGQPGQITNNTLSSCVNGVELSGTSIPVSGNLVLNTSNGISLGANEVGLSASITNNKIVGTGRGIWDNEYGATISGNHITNASIGAIVLEGGSNATVANNVITEASVGVSGVTGANLTGNTLVDVATLTSP